MYYLFILIVIPKEKVMLCLFSFGITKFLVATINRGNTVIEDRHISFNGTCKPLHRQPWLLRQRLLLELRQYKNESMESISMFDLKLPRFFPRLRGEGKGAAISKLIYSLTASSISYTVLALPKCALLSSFTANIQIEKWMKQAAEHRY